MKITKINLLASRDDYQKIEKVFLILRYTVFALSIIFFVSLVIFNYILYDDNKKINDLLNEKQSLLQLINNKQDTVAKIWYLQNKYEALKENIKNDAHFLPYYNLLTSTLTLSTQSANLKSFVIDKNREVEFSVVFSNSKEFFDFFKFVESESFLKNFQKLSLKNFTTMSEKASISGNYELSFFGKFIEINETTN